MSNQLSLACDGFAKSMQLSVTGEAVFDVIKNVVMPNANDHERVAFLMVAQQYKLNPLLKQIHAFSNKGKIEAMIGVDGWVSIANNNPAFDGMEFKYSDNLDWVECIIYRKDRNHPTVIREYYDEVKRNTVPWQQSPRRMLRNRALAQAVRVAFGVGGLYDEDEVADDRKGFAVPAHADKAQPKQAVALVADEDLTLIKSLISATQTDEHKLLKAYAVKSLTDLTVEQAGDAIKKLQAKATKMTPPPPAMAEEDELILAAQQDALDADYEEVPL